MVKHNVLLVCLLVVLSSCSTLPTPRSVDEESSAIGISLKLQAPVKIFSRKPDIIYFVKLKGEEEPYGQAEVIQSNYSKGRHAYLLNAPAGRYAAVAAVFTNKKSANPNAPQQAGVFRTYFPKELIEKTVTEVIVGSIAFMGSYVLGSSVNFDNADETQVHYANLIEPDGVAGLGKNVLSAMLGGGMKVAYVGSLEEFDQSSTAEQTFLDNAEKHLEGGDWTNIINRRKNELERSE